MANKKKFKETKIGAFLKDKAPKILDTIGDVLPDNGAFGVVKNLISSKAIRARYRRDEQCVCTLE